ncbi:hypothetical protein DICPUDRAFT_160365 [Dictyostelium purpureum]|uniref:ABC transporter D family protein n=1 Tax=Dictyostelium purpureum TaxID=5786 RepID=F1A676_DICPU|nr:uncharacterized protein DICPUDRAFT_160365 [Dictyostelium purpureum]EGC28306.1 hypothetical protein DICPUDRAFT_160365 [Dictyostelium purpureum]|eukprot:XP_003295170.1 hypothetical protein DICPUDRAFT_160365 [Dictyostelium purpureum]
MNNLNKNNDIDINIDSSSNNTNNSSNNDYNYKELKKIKENNKFDWVLFKRFLKIIKIIYLKPTIPIVLLVILFGLAVGSTYLSKYTGIVLANIYGSFSTGNKELFLKSLFTGIGAIGSSALLDAIIKFIVSIMAWRWRKVLCLYMQSIYFKKSLFYKIIAFNDKIDNPDQRITSDIDNFTTLLATIVSQCITSPMIVIYYTYLTFTTINWYAPLIVYGYFFLGYFLNKLVMSPMVSINYLQDKLEGDFRYLHQRIRNFAESIALQGILKENFNVSQENNINSYNNNNNTSNIDYDKEYLINNNNNSLKNRKNKKQNNYNNNKNDINKKYFNIDGEKNEKDLVEEGQAKEQFDNLLRNKKRVICWQFGLNTTSDLFSYLSPLVNYFIISLPVFFLNTKSTLLPAEVTVQSYNCIMLASGFSQYISVSTNISDLSGYVSRISTMIEICFNILNDKSLETDLVSSSINNTSVSSSSIPLESSNNFSINHSDNDINQRKIIINNGENIKLDYLSYYSPKGNKLFSNISLIIEKNQNLLIMGPSGCGKSSLIRIINGLWPFFTGTIDKPNNDKIFFLPQQPYLIFGSLESQILYPFSKSDSKRINEKEMRRMFSQFELEYLLDREMEIKNNQNIINDLTHNWLNQLSNGEQQLISIIRLFYHRPQFALLDESTSSIPQNVEEKVYQIAKQLNITTISVGHRLSLLNYHSHLLKFNKNKNWSIEKINNDNHDNNQNNNNIYD